MAKNKKSGNPRKTRVVRSKEERIAALEAQAEALRLRAEISSNPTVKAVLAARSNIRRALKMLAEDPGNAFLKHEKVNDEGVVAKMEEALESLDVIAPIFGGHRAGDLEEEAA